MKLTVLLVCVSLQLACSSAEGRERKHENYCDQGNENDEAGGYILSQQNVAGFCLSQQCKGKKPCQEQSSEIWLIHGLWPTLESNGQMGICYCRNESFVASNVRDIPNIDKYWHDLLQPDPDEFWQHEWETHGTCAISTVGPLSQRQYFAQTINLYVKYNFTDILQRNGIVPSNTTPYNIQEFFAAFKNELNVIPTVTLLSICKDVTYIYSIQLCMDSNFMLTDCTTDCNSEQVYYLENTVTDTL